MTDKYEKVEGMSVGQVVDDNEHLYCLNYETEEFDLMDFEDFSVSEIREFLRDEKIYRKTETPWWEKHVGSIVMTRREKHETWTPNIFEGLTNDSLYFQCVTGAFKQMRPLTQAEKGAIITEG